MNQTNTTPRRTCPQNPPARSPKPRTAPAPLASTTPTDEPVELGQIVTQLRKIADLLEQQTALLDENAYHLSRIRSELSRITPDLS